MTAPWDLQTALNHPAAVHPGDTIWVRGGTYSGQFTSRLNGTAAAPIIVRQYPGERATLDGGTGGPTLTTGGSYAWFWGLEVTSSSPSASKSAVSNYNSLGIKFINLVMHDAGGSGFSSFSANGARQTEIHGSLSYNNGTHFNLDHGMYLQNVAANGTFVVTDNIVFNNEAYGIHIYGQPGESISGFRVEGNVSFGTGSISVPVNRGNDILIGGSTPSSGIVARNNYTYWNVAPPSDPGRWSINLGYLGGVQNGDVVVENNYVVGGLYLAQWSSALVRGNLLYDYGGPMVTLESGWSGHTWDTNQFYGVATLPVWTALPNGATGFGTWKSQTGFSNPGGYSGSGTPPNLVVVRPNQYEAGRANIIIYNWALQGTVSVDLTGVLQPGVGYVVKNAQNFFGAAAASGVYGGGSITLPMAGLTAAAPVGRSYTSPPVTGPAFQVFVVMVVN